MPLIIFLTIIFTRATTLFSSYINDEEGFVAVTRVILHGGTPYISVLDNKPPLLFWWYALWLKLFGDTHILPIHIVGILWVALTCYVIYKIGQFIHSKEVGYFAALCYAIFTTTFTPPYIGVNASLLLSLPLAISFFLILKGRYFFSGVATSLAVFFKYQALMQLPFTFLVLAYLIFIKRKTVKRAMADGLLYFAGFITIVVIIAAILHAQGALMACYEATWKASLSYINLGDSFGNYWHRLFTRCGFYLLATSPLWVAVIIKIFRRTISKPYAFFLWSWLIMNIPAVTAGGRFYSHYWIQLLPAACFIGGVQFWEWWRNSKKAKVAIAIVLAFFAVGWMVPRIMYPYLAKKYGYHSVETEKKIGDFIKANTSKDDKIFVWGTDAAIYIFADRDPASRFLWADSLVGRSPGIDETQKGNIDTTPLIVNNDWKILMEDFAKTPPAIIVDCASGNLRDYGKFPIKKYHILFEYINTNYRKTTTLEGVDVYTMLKKYF